MVSTSTVCSHEQSSAMTHHRAAKPGLTSALTQARATSQQAGIPIYIVAPPCSSGMPNAARSLALEASRSLWPANKKFCARHGSLLQRHAYWQGHQCIRPPCVGGLPTHTTCHYQHARHRQRVGVPAWITQPCLVGQQAALVATHTHTHNATLQLFLMLAYERHAGGKLFGKRGSYHSSWPSEHQLGQVHNALAWQPAQHE